MLAVGLTASLSGCAQEPFASVTPEDCVLLCALVRAIAGPSEDPLPSATPAKPAKKLVHHAVAKPRPAAARPAPTPVSAPLEPTPSAEQVRTPPALPPETSIVPPTAETAPAAQAAPTIDYVQMPGSASIEENTSHFAPMAAEQP